MPAKAENKGVRDLARRAGVEPSTVTKKLNQGKTPEQILAEAATYRLRQAERLAAVSKQQRTPEEIETFSDAQRRKESALADLRELELAEKRRDLVPAAEMKEAWVSICVKVKSAILGMPDKLAPSIVGLPDPMTAKSILIRECETILHTLHGDLEPSNL